MARPRVARPSTKAEPHKEPTDRMKAAAAAIMRGQSVEEAMEAAGYGPGFIASTAGQFGALLEGAGLLPAKPAPTRATKAAAVAPAADKEGDA